MSKVFESPSKRFPKEKRSEPRWRYSTFIFFTNSESWARDSRSSTFGPSCPSSTAAMPMGRLIHANPDHICTGIWQSKAVLSAWIHCQWTGSLRGPENAKRGRVRAVLCVLSSYSRFIPSKGTDDEEAVGGQLCVSIMKEAKYYESRRVDDGIDGSSSVT